MKRIVIAFVCLISLTAYAQVYPLGRPPAPVSGGGPTLMLSYKTCGDTSTNATCTPSTSTSVRDSSASGFHGTWNGAITCTSGNYYDTAGSPTPYPYAGCFQGQYVYYSADSFLPLGAAARSITAYVKVPTTNPNTYHVIFFYGTATTNEMTWFSIKWTGSASVIEISQYGSEVVGATSLTAGSWYRLTATFDGTTWRLYVNGVLDGSGTMTTNTVSGGKLCVGEAICNASSAPFYGDINTVAVYNGVISTP